MKNVQVWGKRARFQKLLLLVVHFLLCWYYCSYCFPNTLGTQFKLKNWSVLREKERDTGCGVFLVGSFFFGLASSSFSLETAWVSSWSSQKSKTDKVQSSEMWNVPLWEWEEADGAGKIFSLPNNAWMFDGEQVTADFEEANELPAPM